MWKVRLRTPLSVYTKNFRLVRLFLIRRGQIKVDQGDLPRISLPYVPVLRGTQEHLSSCACLGPLYNGLFALICICSRTKFNWRKNCCLRTSLVDWNGPKEIIEMAEDDDQFWNKIIMSDEAHVTLNGTVNKQNCRIYATENPQEIQEVNLHDEKVTVWWYRTLWFNQDHVWLSR